MPSLSDPGVFYLLLIAPLGLAYYAQRRLTELYDVYSSQPNRHFASGIEAARLLLERLGLTDVGLERAHGRLADHYDPRSRVLRLSPEVASGRSIASIGIVAHEVGHALQHETGDRLLRLQHLVTLYAAPFVRWGGWLMLAGVVFETPSLIWLAGIGFGGAALAGLISVPVERDASRQAVDLLRDTGLADRIDLDGVREVLSAAAFTYLAGLAQRVAMFLAFLGVVQYFGLHV